MGNQTKDSLFLNIDKSPADGSVNNLNNLLSAIKEKTVLMIYSVSPSNPIQKHFYEIITCIDKSIEITDHLSDFPKVDENFQKLEKTVLSKTIA